MSNDWNVNNKMTTVSIWVCLVFSSLGTQWPAFYLLCIKAGVVFKAKMLFSGSGSPSESFRKCVMKQYTPVVIVQTTLKLSFYSHKPHIELDVYYKKMWKTVWYPRVDVLRINITSDQSHCYDVIFLRLGKKNLPLSIQEKNPKKRWLRSGLGLRGYR